MRVFQIAKLAGVSSRDVLDYLDFVGVYAKHPATKVTGDVFIETVISRLIATKDDFAKVYSQAPF